MHFFNTTMYVGAFKFKMRQTQYQVFDFDTSTKGCEKSFK